ncbi:MAG: hypothetical protein RR162_02645 [Oscillospiraceae bacterium]
MPDIGESVDGIFQRAISSAVRSTTNATKEVAKMLEAIFAEAKKEKKHLKFLSLSGEVAVEKLKSGRENLSKIVIPDEEAAHFKELLKKQGVLFASLDIVKDDGKIIYFPERHRDLVANALSISQAEKGLLNEIKPEAFLKANSGKNLLVAAGMSAIEFELFRYHAQKDGLIFAATKKADVFKAICGEASKEKMDKVLKKVTYDERDPRILEQVEYRISQRKQVNISIEDSEREYFIVSGKEPKNYIHLTHDDFEYYKYNKEVCSLSRNDIDFRQSVFARLEGLVEPVLLTKEEFELNEKEREELINSKTTIYPLNKAYSKDEVNIDSVDSKFNVSTVLTSQASTLESVIKKAQNESTIVNSKEKSRGFNREQEY